MSGRAWITSATTPATIATLISVDIVVRSLFLLNDFLHRADRRRQGPQDLLGQPHPRADVGWLARHDKATPGTAAHRGEHREDLVWCQAVGVHHPAGLGDVFGLDL